MSKYDKQLQIASELLADSYVILRQVAVNDKSNEIPEVKEPDLKGFVVTMDAMYCQKDNVVNIIDNKADYVLYYLHYFCIILL